jgi:hypothetical protein
MIPGRYELVIPRGATFSKTFRIWEDDQLKPLTGYAAKLQARDFPDSPTLLLDLDLTVVDPGEVVVTIPAAETTVLDWLTGVWDLKLIAPDLEADFYLEGPVHVKPTVTR